MEATPAEPRAEQNIEGIGNNIQNNMINFVNIKTEIKEEVTQDEETAENEYDSSMLEENPQFSENYIPSFLNVPSYLLNSTNNHLGMFTPFVKKEETPQYDENEGSTEQLSDEQLNQPLPHNSLQISNEFNMPSTSRSGNFTCGSCNFITDQKVVYDMHVRDCEVDMRYSLMMSSMLVGIKQRCYYCPFESADLETLKQHHNEHLQLGQRETFQCDKCCYSTENRFQLVSHTLTHSKFKCEQCPYVHTYERCVIKHSKNHTFSVKLIAACTSCSFEAVDFGMWEGHLVAHKLSGQAVEISCAGCGFKSDAPFNQKSVEVHQKQTKHAGFFAVLSKFTCAHCLFESHFKWDYLHHMKAYHPASTPTTLKALSCGKCAFVALTSIELKQHFEVKHARVVYKCEGCQFQTRRKERYDLHMINVTLTQKHEKRHHRITELAQYKCQSCGFIAINEGDLKTHDLLHKNQELLVSVNANNVGHNNFGESSVANLEIRNGELQSETSDQNKEINDVNVKSEITDDIKIIQPDLIKQECTNDNSSLKRLGDDTTDLNSIMLKKIKTAPYKCFYCEFEADKKIEVDRHEKTTHRTFDGIFTCPYCAYETTKRCDMRRHYTRKHQNSIQCSTCPYETGSKSDYIQHCAGHKRDGLHLHKCTVCDYTSDRKSMVQRHELVHKETTLSCDICDYKTRRKDDLIRHRKSKHDVTEPPKMQSTEASNVINYKCLSCCYETVEEIEFNSHIEFHNTNGHTVFYKCTECQNKFPNLDLFQSHQIIANHSRNLVTIEVSTFDCGLCTYKSWSQEEADDHSKWHESDGHTYKCLGCNFVTIFEKEFNDHISNHSVNKETPYFKCDFEFCDTIFSDVNSFKDHTKQTKHNGKLVTIDILKFSCSKCLYITWRKNLLDSHLKTHKYVTYKCLSCSFDTRLPDEFSKHNLFHDRSKQKLLFKCMSYCGCPDLDIACNLTFSSFNKFRTHIYETAHSRDLVTVIIDPSNENVISRNAPKTTEVVNSKKKNKVTKQNHQWFLCLGCRFQTRSDENFKTHIANHESNQETTYFVCNAQISSKRCDLKFKTVDDLQLHQNEFDHDPYLITIDVLTFDCHLCGYKTPHTKEINLHMKSPAHKLLAEKSKYKCLACSFETSNKDDFLVHMTHHQTPGNKNVVRYICYCSVQFSQLKALEDHQRKSTHISNEIVANVTKSTAKNKIGTEKYVYDKTDSNMVKFKCLSCDFETTFLDGISHIDKHYKNNLLLLYTCEHCGIELETEDALTEHKVKTKHNLNRVAIMWKDLSSNEMISGPAYECLTCKVEIKKKTDFHSHSWYHKNNNETIFFECTTNLCNMTFKNITDLRIHQETFSHNPFVVSMRVLKLKDPHESQQPVLHSNNSELTYDVEEIPTVPSGNLDVYKIATENKNIEIDFEADNYLGKEKIRDDAIIIDSDEDDLEITNILSEGSSSHEKIDIKENELIDMKFGFQHPTVINSGVSLDVSNNAVGQIKFEYESFLKVKNKEIDLEENEGFCDNDVVMIESDPLNEIVPNKIAVKTMEVVKNNNKKKKVTKQNRRWFMCLGCKFQTSSYENFSMHIVNHKNHEETTYFTCNSKTGAVRCNSRFKTLEDLQCHQKKLCRNSHLITIDVLTFDCHLCGYKTWHIKEIDLHMKSPEHELLANKSSNVLRKIAPKTMKVIEKHKEITDQNFQMFIREFECLGCEFRTTSNEDINTHIANHESNQETTYFICNAQIGSKRCDLKFKTVDDLQLHQNELDHDTYLVTMDVLTFDCHLCGYKTPHTKEIDLHMKSPAHKLLAEKCKYKCLACSFETTKKDNFLVHMTHHQTPADVVCYICYCSVQFSQLKALEDHQRKSTHISNEIVANVTKSKIKNKIGTENNVDDKTDSNMVKFKCLSCDFETTFLDGISHIDKHYKHNLLLLYTCEHCGIELETEDALTEHKVKTKHNLNRVAIMWKDLSSNEMIYGPAYECLTCKVEIKKKTDFYSHSWDHRNNNETVFFECTANLCNMTFTNITDLRIHKEKFSHNPFIVSIHVLKLKDPHKSQCQALHSNSAELTHAVQDVITTVPNENLVVSKTATENTKTKIDFKDNNYLGNKKIPDDLETTNILSEEVDTSEFKLERFSHEEIDIKENKLIETKCGPYKPQHYELCFVAELQTVINSGVSLDVSKTTADQIKIKSENFPENKKEIIFKDNYLENKGTKNDPITTESVAGHILDLERPNITRKEVDIPEFKSESFLHGEIDIKENELIET